MTKTTRGGRLFLRQAAFAVIAALSAWLATGEAALSQSAECTRLRQAIANASGGRGAQFAAAAERQRADLDRAIGYANSIGCQNRKFLFFGANPPAQCGELNGQIARMQGNLADLRARSGGGDGGRGELVARYNSLCVGAQAQPQPQQRSGNLLDALFGGGKQEDVTIEPIAPDPQPSEKPIDQNPSEARAGSNAVCVRACDGAFFPVSYAASSSRLSDLEDRCRLLCPNAEVSLFTYPGSGEITQAVSLSGQRYVDSPNALKYRQTFDPTCSCRRRGQSWADALAAAEARYGREARTDILVTPEKSVEMSRPIVDPKAKPGKTPAAAPQAATLTASPAAKPMMPAATTPGLDANGADAKLSAQAATISREASGIAGGDAQTGARFGEDQGQQAETIGPDGVNRRVRIVGPTL